MRFEDGCGSFSRSKLAVGELFPADASLLTLAEGLIAWCRTQRTKTPAATNVYAPLCMSLDQVGDEARSWRVLSQRWGETVIRQ